MPLGPDVGEAWGGFVQEHVLTRSVRDSAAVLDVTSGADESAPYAAPPPARSFLEAVTADPGRLRVAFTSEPLFGRSTHAECRAAVEDAAKLCESLGHDVQQATPRFDKAAARRAFMVVVAASVARDVQRAGELMGRRPAKAGFEPATWFLRAAGRRLGAVDYEAALDTAHEVRRSFAAFFADHDILLTPTLPQPPVAVGALQPHGLDAAALAVLPYLPLGPALQPLLVKFAADTWEAMGNTMVVNQTGQPAMSVPLAWSADGLPIGLQFVARYGEEATLFSLAGQLETARPWAQRRPPRFSDAAPAEAVATGPRLVRPRPLAHKPLLESSGRGQSRCRRGLRQATTSSLSNDSLAEQCLCPWFWCRGSNLEGPMSASNSPARYVLVLHFIVALVFGVLSCWCWRTGSRTG